MPNLETLLTKRLIAEVETQILKLCPVGNYRWESCVLLHNGGCTIRIITRDEAMDFIKSILERGGNIYSYERGELDQ